MRRVALALLLSCSSPQPSDAGADGTTISCEIDPRTMTYTNGMTVKGKTVEVTITTATPAPPAKGTNTWKVDPHVAGATLDFSIFMPDHGHGSSVVPKVTAQPDGTFLIENIYFFMPGLWRATFVVNGDPIVFYFCIAG